MPPFPVPHWVLLMVSSNCTTPVFPTFIIGSLAFWSPRSEGILGIILDLSSALMGLFLSQYFVASLAYTLLIHVISQLPPPMSFSRSLCHSWPFPVHHPLPCVLPDWAYSLPWSWRMTHFLQNEAFYTVFKSIHIAHLPLATISSSLFFREVISASPSHLSHDPPVFVPQVERPLPPPPFFTWYVPFQSIWSLTFLRTIPEPLGCHRSPFSAFPTPSLGTLYLVLSPWIHLSTSPTRLQAPWEHWCFLDFLCTQYQAPMHC